MAALALLAGSAGCDNYNPNQRLAILDVESGRSRTISPGDRSVSMAVWSPDSEAVLVQDLLLTKGEQLLLDTNAFIYFLDGAEPYYNVLVPVFRRVAAGDLAVMVSAITEAELLVRPERERNDLAKERIEDLLAENGIYVIGVDRRIARRAAAIRARGNLKLPDAIIVATALETDCEAIVGNDGQWAKKDVEIPFIRLDDLVKG